ncbi:MAG: hypothetical protein K0S39_3616 [Paenibacillus sp.]|jgi:hypothetical protein|nr:hypothetical protein [Paenibacillus sp.]
MINIILFIISGASTSGIKYVIPQLRRLLPHYDIFDAEIMEGRTWEIWVGNWLQVAYNIGQSNRRTIIFGNMYPVHSAGINKATLINHYYYLNLHCSDGIRSERLLSSGWDQKWIDDAKKYSDWLYSQASNVTPPMPIIDVDHISISEVAEKIKQWVLSCEY